MRGVEFFCFYKWSTGGEERGVKGVESLFFEVKYRVL